MIPILYEKTETAFVSNGLARLRDCISCIVSEERNSIYECDFEYPVDGANYDLIQVGRIIGVTHDDTGEIQPFDIVSYTKPIDGVVTFHAVHISYRQSYMTVKGTSINSLADAFTLLGTATPSNPFTYWTDKTSSAYLGCMDGTPRSVRETLGGVEGSILDAYGGEYEFDKWTVKLWSARGQYRDFSIRYGVNMLDYNEEFDSTNTYSSCIPYWTDGTTTIVGDKQTSGGIPLSGREQCIPLDVSEKFESQPTKAQVNSMGLSVMNASNPTVPTQTIEVSFVRLQDMGEFADYQNLLQCKLCDTINVIFPDFNSSGQFKIVKTEWNVLTGKYESMELGDLSISLSEALGINDIQHDSKSTIEQIQTKLESSVWQSPLTLSTLRVFGYCTASAKEVELYCPIGIQYTSVSLPTSGTFNLLLRGGSGGTINTSFNVSAISSYSISNGIFIVRVVMSTAFAGGNNTSVVGSMSGINITFTI